ncbi:tetratricopeptide repeat protein [Phyllobacterium zundukense]|nr:hypothetical protein [Phyllobacterium zundukense]
MTKNSHDTALITGASSGIGEMAVRLDPSDPEAHAVMGTSLGVKGDFVRAKAEFDTALRLAPGRSGNPDLLYCWASTFGEPERGAELVDQVMQLDPHFPKWASGQFS